MVGLMAVGLHEMKHEMCPQRVVVLCLEVTYGSNKEGGGGAKKTATKGNNDANASAGGAGGEEDGERKEREGESEGEQVERGLRDRVNSSTESNSILRTRTCPFLITPTRTARNKQEPRKS